MELSNIKRIFFIGIGGIGISALAKMAISRGIEVSGINDEDSPKTLEPLREAGARIFFEKDMKELPEANLYVYSDAWVYRGPQLLEQARMTGMPVLSYFEALGLFAKEYKVIAISGTHGKTTTTAMVAEIMIEVGLDPTVVVGSFVKKFGSNFREGKGEYLVVEADEYNRHFLNFKPFIGVVTNIEADHLDVYKDIADIQSAFDQFLAQSENCVVGSDIGCPLGHPMSKYEKYVDKVPKLLVPGEHNRQNAAAAFAVADILKIDESVVEKALSEFSGTWRRLEKIGTAQSGAVIYDDYAHHPTEVRASIQALRELYPKGEYILTILFQPHLYSRTKALFQDFAAAFLGADKVFILPIYFAREAVDESVSSEKLAQAITENGVVAGSFGSFEEAEGYITGLNLGKKDVFVTMGAGEAYKVAEKVFPI